MGILTTAKAGGILVFPFLVQVFVFRGVNHCLNFLHLLAPLCFYFCLISSRGSVKCLQITFSKWPSISGASWSPADLSSIVFILLWGRLMPLCSLIFCVGLICSLSTSFRNLFLISDAPCCRSVLYFLNWVIIVTFQVLGIFLVMFL